MRVVLTIQESRHGLWRICSGPGVLFDGLRFAHAIRLARGIARERHTSSGCTVYVEMICAEFTIALAKYASPGPGLRQRTAVI